MAALAASVFTMPSSVSPSTRDRPDDDDQQRGRDGDAADRARLRTPAELDVRRRQRDQNDRDQHNDEHGPPRGARRTGGLEFRFGGCGPTAIADEGLVGDLGSTFATNHFEGPRTIPAILMRQLPALALGGPAGYNLPRVDHWFTGSAHSST